MKNDRMTGILSLLLQNEKVTAPELAEYFAVSRRTINRDIEELCRAGIPITATRGVGGGLRIKSEEGSERGEQTTEAMQMIQAGLERLDSIKGSRYYSQLLEQLHPNNVHLKAEFDSSLKAQLSERFGAHSFEVREDGTLFLETDANEEDVLSWILSCGDKATVLAPKSVRDKLFAITFEAALKYQT